MIARRLGLGMERIQHVPLLVLFGHWLRALAGGGTILMLHAPLKEPCIWVHINLYRFALYCIALRCACNAITLHTTLTFPDGSVRHVCADPLVALAGSLLSMMSQSMGLSMDRGFAMSGFLRKAMEY